MIKRAITGSLYVVVMATCLYMGMWYWLILLTFLYAFSLSEYFAVIVEKDTLININMIGLAVAWFVVALGGHYYYINLWEDKPISLPIGFMLLFLGLILITLILVIMAINDKKQRSFNNLIYCYFGIIYLGIGFFALGFLRHNVILSIDGNRGMIFTFACVIGVWCSDTFAYLTGKFIGKNKLAPSISPNKTIEGMLGGLVAVVIFEVLFLTYFNQKAVWYHSVIYGVILTLVATLGDLLESLWKRNFSIKDSGKVLPGHGGIFDRVDALITAAPFSYFYWYLINNYFGVQGL